MIKLKKKLSHRIKYHFERYRRTVHIFQVEKKISPVKAKIYLVPKSLFIIASRVYVHLKSFLKSQSNCLFCSRV